MARVRAFIHAVASCARHIGPSVTILPIRFASFTVHLLLSPLFINLLRNYLNTHYKPKSVTRLGIVLIN